MSIEQVPTWLSQVQGLSTEVSLGQSDTGAALAALADVLGSVTEGTALGAVVRLADGSVVHAQLCSRGDLAADAARVAVATGAPTCAVSLVTAAALSELRQADASIPCVQIS